MFATSSDHLFSRFLNRYFVETGTYLGHGIDLAIRAGFNEVRSIELSRSHFSRCKAKYRGCDDIKLYFGDSALILSKVISDIDSSITFWLDGHYSGPGTAKGSTLSPILQELMQIKNHPIKTHTIIIDDVRLMGGVSFDFVTLKEIKSFILTINPDYCFSLEEGYQKDDILVAYFR